MPPTPAPIEPWLAELVDDALAPFARGATEEEVAFVREELLAAALHDPRLAELVLSAAAPTVDRSGTVLKREIAGDPPGDEAVGAARRR